MGSKLYRYVFVMEQTLHYLECQKQLDKWGAFKIMIRHFVLLRPICPNTKGRMRPTRTRINLRCRVAREGIQKRSAMSLIRSQGCEYQMPRSVSAHSHSLARALKYLSVYRFT